MKNPCVYILASQKRGTLYIGVTSNMTERLMQHKSAKGSQFTSDYNVTRLVWIQFLDTMPQAIQREKSLKRYPREWKINLIEQTNPDWRELSPQTGEPIFPPRMDPTHKG